MLRIISLNLNGIRSAWSKNVLPLGGCAESRCRLSAGTESAIARLDAGNAGAGRYAGLLPLCAKKRVTAGLASGVDSEPDRVVEGFDGGEFDAEGRYIRADFGNLSVISLYLPSGSSSPERQEAKFRFLDAFFPQMLALRGEGREIVLCGDWNIAHQEIDLKNWKSNQKNSGFLPEERAWLTKVFDELGWVDVYRRLHPEATAMLATLGGAIAARPGPRMSGGGSTTRSPPRGLLRRHQLRSLQSGAFSDHAPADHRLRL
jgi:exodeoxyribonuclease-3